MISTSSSCALHLRHLHSFPTRRSSDLPHGQARQVAAARSVDLQKRVLNQIIDALRITAAREEEGAQLLFEREIQLIERVRSEEHTSELQSLRHLVCRLLLEKKKIQISK